jgi:hypothetical protein
MTNKIQQKMRKKTCILEHTYNNIYYTIGSIRRYTMKHTIEKNQYVTLKELQQKTQKERSIIAFLKEQNIVVSSIRSSYVNSYKPTSSVGSV